MTLHFPWLHAPRWLAHAHVNRAMTLVLGVIGVSLLFGALRVLDVAISGASVAPESLLLTEPTSAGAPVDASMVDVPSAAVEAISL